MRGEFVVFSDDLEKQAFQELRPGLGDAQMDTCCFSPSPREKKKKEIRTDISQDYNTFPKQDTVHSLGSRKMISLTMATKWKNKLWLFFYTASG